MKLLLRAANIISQRLVSASFAKHKMKRRNSFLNLNESSSSATSGREALGRSTMQSCPVIAVASIALLLLAAALYLVGDVTEVPQYARSLRLDRQAYANLHAYGLNSTMTVYLLNPPMPIFNTDIFQRYSSGRFDYDIQERPGCDCNKQPPLTGNAPCLVVANIFANCPIEQLKCMYPECKTMITNDEKCKAYGYDVREYYSSRKSHVGYLPLGPREDSWASFHKMQQKTDFVITPSSKRKYAFNAIFSKSTNKIRGDLAQMIESRQVNGSDLKIYTKMSKKWHMNVNDPHNEQLNTDQYMNVLLESVFTLAPAGHNAECYRMFEAVEAGSIPIFAKSYLNTARRCRGSLDHWLSAPVVMLDSWDDLYDTVDRLMGDPQALDEMQVKLRLWYDDYMFGVVGRFEDYMINSYGQTDVVQEKVSQLR